MVQRACSGARESKSSVGRKLLWLIPLAGALCISLSAPSFAQEKADAELTRGLNAQQRALLDTIKSLWKGDPDVIKVKLWASRRRPYHFGENMKLTVETDKDAYVYLIDQGPSGRTHYLVPNQWHQSALRLKARTPATIPADDGSWNINVGGPRGAEMIYAIASSKPFSAAHRERLLREIRSGEQFPQETKPTRATFRDLIVSRGEVRRGTANLKVYVVP
jgi:hypothetical protein